MVMMMSGRRRFMRSLGAAMVFGILRLDLGSLAPEPVSLMPRVEFDRSAVEKAILNYWLEVVMPRADRLAEQYQEAMGETT